MDAFRIALANLRFAAIAEDSIMLAEKAIAQASLPVADYFGRGAA